MMKKILSFVLSALACATIFTATASAANVKMDIEPEEIAAVGEEISVTLSIDDLSCALLSTGIKFDPAEFECVDIIGAGGYLPEDEDPDPSWFYLVDKDKKRNAEIDPDPAPSMDNAAKGTISAVWNNSNDVNWAGGIVFTAKLKVLKDGATIKLFETCNVNNPDAVDVNLDGQEGRPYSQEVAINVASNEPVTPPAPAADVTIKGAYKTTNTEWVDAKGNTLWWGVDYAEGKFPGEVEVTIFSAEKEKKFNVGLDASIQGEVSFGVFAIVGDSTDALNIKVGDVTGAGYVAFADAPVAE